MNPIITIRKVIYAAHQQKRLETDLTTRQVRHFAGRLVKVVAVKTKYFSQVDEYGILKVVLLTIWILCSTNV
ncbi:MAG: hypothetical protein R2744_08460 [Bacteroidales bacterium]